MHAACSAALLTTSSDLVSDAVASGSSTPVKDSSTSTSGVKGRSKWKVMNCVLFGTVPLAIYKLMPMLLMRVIFMQEAALRAKQGLHNIDFTRHPRAEAASRAYLILHHPAFYITHLVVSVLLMLLALAEWPTLLLDDSQAYRNWFLPVSSTTSYLCIVCNCCTYCNYQNFIITIYIVYMQYYAQFLAQFN